MKSGNGTIGKSGNLNELSLDNESTLLLNCCHLSLSQSQCNTVTELIDDGIDWDILMEKANWHQLLPLVSFHLTKPEFRGIIPKIKIEKMQRCSYASLARNMLFQNELSHIVSLFNEQGIAVIVIKGAAFLGTIYEDIALRPMNDLDILVHEEDLLRAEAIAIQQGYKSVRENTIIDQEDKLRHLPNLVHTEKHIMLEIHKHITDIDGPYKIVLDDIWSRASHFTIHGTPALTLSREDHLVHLATNFLLDRRYNSQHALGQLCDISELIIKYQDEIDWRLVEKIVTETHISPSLFFTLYACNRLLETPVPEYPFKNLQPADFDYKRANLFLKRRVVDEKAWLIHSLVDHESDYSMLESVKSGIKRLMPNPKRIFRKDQLNEYYRSMYLTQLRDKVKRVIQAVRKPSELKENLTLDQWLHDLYKEKNHRIS